MPKQTLLEKAKQAGNEKPRLRNVSEEQIELALAWVNDEISLTQIAVALTGKRNASMIYSKLATILKEIIRSR